MKSIFKLLSIAVIGAALSCPTIEARGRTNGNNGNSTPNTTQSHKSPNTPKPTGGNGQRPGTSNPGQRPGGNSPAQRPGGNVNRPANGSKPNGGNNQGTKPDNGTKPGGQQPGGGHGPGNNFGPGQQPGGGHGPGNNFGPGQQPGGGHGPGNHPGGGWGHVPNYAPPRPHMMPPRPFTRPTPPPAFRPGPRYPIIHTILGVSLGTALNLSLDYLINGGYYVTGYTNDAVYLNDVMQLNFLWPNATLYYNRGRLMASEFVYSTPYFDTNRYYQVYNELTRAYGMPITRTTVGMGGMECTWFGYDGQYVTLQFVPGVAANGMNRYYTTLSFGM